MTSFVRDAIKTNIIQNTNFCIEISRNTIRNDTNIIRIIEYKNDKTTAIDLLVNITENTLNTIRNITNISENTPGENIKNHISKQHNKFPNLILAVITRHKRSQL